MRQKKPSKLSGDTKSGNRLVRRKAHKEAPAFMELIEVISSPLFE